MATNTSQPLNQKPVGNPYMDQSTGQTYASAPSAVAPAPISKNTTDQFVAPDSMPGYSGLGRRVTNPDFVAPTTGTSPINTPQSTGTPNTPYTIKQGDTLSGIAKAQGMSMADIVKNNPSINDPSKIAAGGNLNLGPQSQYKQGLNSVPTGTPPPQGGSATANAKQFLPATQPDTSTLNTQMAEDKGYQKLIADQKAFDDVSNQRTSLTDEYKKMVSEAGIPALNTQLMNMKNVIEGTEDDIRNEVTKAGGFATDSQVLAMTNARNKQLVKNYNTLLDTKQMAMETVNTMIGLADKDRSFAQQNIMQKMQIDEKIMNYRDKMVDNARQSYQKVIENLGYDGLYKSTGGDPYYTSLIEKSLGLQSGGLKQLASQPNLDKQLKTVQIENQKSNLLTDKAQRAKIYADIEKDKNESKSHGTIDGKAQNQSQSSANSYANRLNEANVVLTQLGTKFTGSLSQVPLPNMLKSGDRQSYEQAQNNFITAVLRRESGASISPSEFDTARDQYFPQPGDKPSTVVQKEKSRNTVINNFYHEANVDRPILPGQIIEVQGKKYRVDSSGEMNPL